MDQDKNQLRAEKQAQKLEAKAAKEAGRRAQEAQKQALKAAKEADRRAQEAQELEMYGREVAAEMLTMGTIRIYEKGYVRVGGLFMNAGNFEKLKSFEVFNNNLTKKTGLGRGAAAVVTGGLNLLSPNTRGNIIVTIVTDANVHTGELLPQVQMIRSVNILQAAAQSVLESNSKETPAAVTQGDDLSASLERLVKLRDSGALSQEEFEKAKAKLLQ
jgi:hypothetical protein